MCVCRHTPPAPFLEDLWMVIKYFGIFLLNIYWSNVSQEKKIQQTKVTTTATSEPKKCHKDYILKNQQQQQQKVIIKKVFFKTEIREMRVVTRARAMAMAMTMPMLVVVVMPIAFWWCSHHLNVRTFSFSSHTFFNRSLGQKVNGFLGNAYLS